MALVSRLGIRSLKDRAREQILRRCINSCSDYHAITVQRHYAEQYTKEHIHQDAVLYQSAVILLVQQVEADTPYR